MMSQQKKTPMRSIITIPQTSTSTQSPEHQVHIVTNLFDPSECSTIIAQHSNLVPANGLRDTIRDREIFDDEDLRDILWERLRGFFGNEKIVDGHGSEWAAEGLNERFRLCRYLPGGKFAPHQDGNRFASVNERSFMAVNIYLNTVSEENQGATRFLDPDFSSIVLAKVQPVLGTAAIFRDDVWHDGEELVGGEKYLLRTDLMYRRVKEFDFEKIHEDLDDHGKGLQMLDIAQRLEDSGKGTEAIEWYKKAFKTWPALERSL